MSHTTGWFIAVLCLVLTGDSLADNYPSTANTKKPCARRKNTMMVQGPLCQWDNTTNSYSPDSVALCGGDYYSAKRECPEFNQASCEKYKDIHCCRLRYKTTWSTWMEVYYANQYKPGDYLKPEDNVYDVIEIHRKVDDDHEKDFGKVNQPDYPDNVLDPQGARGLKWIDVKSPKKHNFTAKGPFCKNMIQDARCTDLDEPGTSYRYLRDNYPEGFDPSCNIPRTAYENQIRATISITYESACRDALVSKTKVPTCTVYYRRNGVPKDNNKATAITSFIFMEAQLIFDEKGNFKCRYAYWNIEDAEIRDLIFKDKDWYMGPGL